MRSPDSCRGLCSLPQLWVVSPVKGCSTRGTFFFRLKVIESKIELQAIRDVGACMQLGSGIETVSTKTLADANVNGLDWGFRLKDDENLAQVARHSLNWHLRYRRDAQLVKNFTKGETNVNGVWAGTRRRWPASQSVRQKPPWLIRTGIIERHGIEAQTYGAISECGKIRAHDDAQENQKDISAGSQDIQREMAKHEFFITEMITDGSNTDGLHRHSARREGICLGNLKRGRLRLEGMQDRQGRRAKGVDGDRTRVQSKDKRISRGKKPEDDRAGRKKSASPGKGNGQT